MVSWKICGRRRTRNILIIAITFLVAGNICFSTLFVYSRKGQSDADYDKEMIGGMQSVSTALTQIVDDGNSGLPLDAEILSDLFGFRCKCDLGYRPAAIVIVHSYSQNQELRSAIRKTWGSPEQCRRYGVVLRFVMGRPRTIQQSHLLKTEIEQHRDMIIGNFSSIAYLRSTTLQSFLVIRWSLEFCPPAPYLVQACDRTFMRLDKLGDIMNRFSEGEHAIVGFRVNFNTGIYDLERNLLLDAPAVNRTYFPTFASLSAGFAMPLIMALHDYVETLSETNIIQFIDIYYGFAAEKYSWTVRHNDAFSRIELKGAEDSCIMNSRFTAISPRNIGSTYDIWRNITDPNFVNNCQRHETADNNPQRWS